jgi:uncharacterized protein (TIGR00661 family)
LKEKFNIHTVLVAPLDWGLGHATRCIPLIRALQSAGYNVLIGSDGPQKVLLKKEFPSLPILTLKGYNIRYTKTKWLLPLKLLSQLPKMYAAIQYEHNWLDTAIDKYKIDLVLSDNRFGLHSSKIPCIFITHQLTIKAPFPWLEKRVQKINYAQINQFIACWVPDVPGEINLAGILSHPTTLPKIPVYYMGILSRFERDEQEVMGKKYDYCIIISGPEPQRTVLENKIILDSSTIEGNILLVRGKPGNADEIQVSPNVEVKNHLSGTELQQAFNSSKYIISRSGYTTVMELLSLQRKSILLPTPGQTEQEYLAERLLQQGWCFTLSQDKFNLLAATKAADEFSYSTLTLPVFDVDKLRELLFPIQATVID